MSSKLLVVSPHLDDAVLSYGGRIAELSGAGADVTVYTVFAGDPCPPYSAAADQYHSMWGISTDPVAPRRREDLQAQAAIGARAEHGRFLDAIYRTDETGGWVVPEGDPVDYDVAEPALTEQVRDDIVDAIGRTQPDLVLTCAAIGGHLDHVRARDATLAAAADLGVAVRLWDDFPYTDWASGVPAFPAGWQVSAPVAEPITQAGWQAWRAAVQSYPSQLGMLEQDGTPLPVWFEQLCHDRAERYGAGGLYVVTRRADFAAARS